MVLTTEQKSIISATVPTLVENGLKVTQTFYESLLHDYPSLKHLFSHSAQITSHQATALAGALHAYASHIDDLTPILPVVERINQKHASLNIQPEQYALVGEYLLKALREVLGEDIFTDKVRNAWAAAYSQLAELCIVREEEIMIEHDKQPGGWRGWREMKIVNKIQESNQVMSFYMTPVDKTGLPDYKPGQYVSIRVNVSDHGYKQCRQYSLSHAPSSKLPSNGTKCATNGTTNGYHNEGNTFRITVKKESGIDISDPHAQHHPGYVSNVLHDQTQVGDIVELSHPAGEFYLDTERALSAANPIVLLSAGVGITPVMSMLETITATEPHSETRPISWIHVAKNRDIDAFVNDVKAITSQYSNVQSKVFHSKPLPEEEEGEDYDFEGRLNLTRVKNLLHLEDIHAEYFMCGPNAFMREIAGFLKQHSVDSRNIHMEVFGAGGYDLVQT